MSRTVAVVAAALLAVFAAGCNQTKLDALPATHSEIHFQGGEKPPVDVVFVVDDSGSMREDQQKLGENFASFIQHFTALNLDYRLAVITTDVAHDDRKGKFHGGVITPETPQADRVFLENVAVGTEGSPAESGLVAIRMAFQDPDAVAHNGDFLRPDAILAVVIVSDEEDFSDGDSSEPDPADAPPVDEIVSFLLSLKDGDPAKVIMPVIVGDIPDGCTGADGVKAEPGFRYHEAATALNGSKSSICSDDFATVLDEIGSELAGLVTAFPLDYTPDPETITVRVDEVIVPHSETSGWYWDTNVGGIAFAPSAIPEACAKIEVSYAVEDFGGPIGTGNAEAPPEECPAFAPPISTSNALEGGYFACTVAGLGASGNANANAAAATLALAGLVLAATMRRRRRC